MQREEGARPGRGIYIFFMILFNLTRLTAESVPSQVLLGGGCAQKADRVKPLPRLPPSSQAAPTWGDLRHCLDTTSHSASLSPDAAIKQGPETQLKFFSKLTEASTSRGGGGRGREEGKRD